MLYEYHLLYYTLELPGCW